MVFRKSKKFSLEKFFGTWKNFDKKFQNFDKISQNLKFTPHKITWVNGQMNSVAHNMRHDIGDTDKIIRIIIFELAWFDIIIIFT